MHTPTKTQWQTVIDNFEKVLPMATLKKHLDMSEPCVRNFDHKCGTVHCVGGWYAVAVINHYAHEFISYTYGADIMAKDLGFRDHESLELWSEYNPEIWGNEYGSYMFIHKDAYNYAETLYEVVEFLKGVRDRSPD